MKEQYVGDISDYRKYALLRVLADQGRNRIGVCWMLTPPDGNKDGQKISYLGQPEQYRHFDPELFDVLVNAVVQSDQRRLHSIENSGAIPGAQYFNTTLGTNIRGRQAYMDMCRAEFARSDLVFFDPDNGIEVSLKKGRKGSSKYVYLDEVSAFYEDGKSVLIYQHFPFFIKREITIAKCGARLNACAPGAQLWAFRTTHVVFLLLVHPDQLARIIPAAERAAVIWDPNFIRGCRLEPPTFSFANRLSGYPSR